MGLETDAQRRWFFAHFGNEMRRIAGKMLGSSPQPNVEKRPPGLTLTQWRQQKLKKQGHKHQWELGGGFGKSQCATCGHTVRTSTLSALRRARVSKRSIDAIRKRDES